MRPRNEETYEDWCERARKHELAVAHKKIAQGQDINGVMEEMTRRLLSKISHPVYEVIRESFTNEYDNEKSKAEYNSHYRDKRGPVADHIVE